VDTVACISTRLAIEDLNANFTYFLDHNQVDELAGLFTEDAIYAHGERRDEGRIAIHQLFAKRRMAGSRTTRHLYSGLRVFIESAERARGECVCLTFAADESPPITPAIPYLVADFSDVYVRCADHQWRIKQRIISRIFVAESNTGPVGYSRLPVPVDKESS
jgi:SnoaL-like domain